MPVELAAALSAAEADGLAEAGTEHLLLGLLTDGVAAATLEQLGVTRDKIRDASRRLFDYPAEPDRTGTSVFSAEAQAALLAAEQLATERTPTCARSP
ncbi:Clp protease N-terminal domain-containing protein [Streptomyces sp. NBC_01799]|uniref:Clp protease N-terminal domain-containing protein n=1 Tax=Streptomyces sp. NBC_01800 TaxID=2975945 RepID=UPI002DD94ABE|nr:Clp protease N-terminal domain-containing protein [Streptomyces sp. NBC_01800]WSA72503.1 Clp protease N-terminal domain-containing protein [Streptomyces sp. NBC_01800]WSA81028.1 Clp protease N-terminal domain-containing protein [Streptomyces sp. NBC_01799]